MLDVAALSKEQRDKLQKRIVRDMDVVETVSFNIDVAAPHIGTVLLFPHVDYEVGQIEEALPEYLCGCHTDGFGNLYCIPTHLPEPE